MVCTLCRTTESQLRAIILETSEVNPKFLQDLDVTVLISEHLAANLLVGRQFIFTVYEFWLKTALDCVAFYHNIH